MTVTVLCGTDGCCFDEGCEADNDDSEGGNNGRADSSPIGVLTTAQ